MAIIRIERGLPAPLAPYVQSYAVASRTHTAMTAADPTAAPALYTQAHSEALRAEINRLRTDIDNVKQVLNAVIDDLQWG